MNEGNNNDSTDYAKLSQDLFNYIKYFNHDQFEQCIEDIKNLIETLNKNTASLWFIYREFQKSMYGKINLPEQQINNIYSDFKNWDVEKNDDEKEDDVIKNLHRIREINSDFYYKLAFIFSIITNKNSITQNTETYNKVNDPKNGIEALSKKISEQSEELQTFEKNLENKIKNNVYSEFITILGIFTAITFAIFGGINTINSISSNLNISSNNPQNLGNLLIGAAVLGIVLFGIITVLFAGIAKITEKDYNLPPLLTISVLAIISAMFMIGLVFTFLADNWNLSIWPQIIISVVVIIAVAIFTKCKSNKSLKSSNNEKQTDNSSTSENN